MNNRNYNIFFNLHTVSGIVISVGLYVIFFAGAFTLFAHAIHHWEENTPLSNHPNEETLTIDYNRVIDTLKAAGYDMYGRSIYISLEGEEEQSIYLSGTEDSLASEEAKKGHQLVFNTKTYELSKKNSSYSFGSLLYDLHFYYQLGRPGYYLSGAVALFFMFCIVTGILVHWKKIVSNFYVFRPMEKLKTVWTDAHTALGVIGIPFQFMYALTGAMFGLGILVSLSASVLYNGEREKYYEDLYGEHHDSLGSRADVSAYSLNAFLDSAKSRWEGFTPKYTSVLKCESNTIQFRAYGYLDTKTKFLNGGEVVYDVISGKVNHEHSPYEVSYIDGIWLTVWKLHYGDYGDLGNTGNYLLKFIYFIMAIITCFVIITGVLIWLEARNKKHIPEKERRYNERVGYIYLAICLSMYPVTAILFVIAKLLPLSMSEYREIIFNSLFFGGWLLLSVFFFLKKDNHYTNKYTLLTGGVIGLFIPVVNGLHTGNWIWYTFSYHHYDVFIIDALWIFISVVSLYVVYRLKPAVATSKIRA